MSPDKSEKSTGTTTQPVVAETNNAQRPEWLRIPDTRKYFGVSRSWLYPLITAGTIKSVCLRNRGAQRGIRLVSFDSLNAYIASQAQEAA